MKLAVEVYLISEVFNEIGLDLVVLSILIVVTFRTVVNIAICTIHNIWHFMFFSNEFWTNWILDPMALFVYFKTLYSDAI